MSHAALHQLGLLALEDFVVASNKHREALTHVELLVSPPHGSRGGPGADAGAR